ncbi:unnamed protein product [Merluccius merluccius]
MTTPHCGPEDCNCNGAPCIFNQTVGRCQCHCADFTFGDTCVFGQNDIPVVIAQTTRRQARHARDIFSFAGFTELNNRAPTTHVVAEAIAEYNYPNNNSQIHFLNNDIGGVLEDILNTTSALSTIGQAFGDVTAQLNGVLLQPTAIKNITFLQPYVDCQHANYSTELTNGSWECVGSCKTIPDYCHYHGQCLNHIYNGPICRCESSALEHYSGPRCESFGRGPGFYGALFGSLGGALLLVLVITGAVLLRRFWRNKPSHEPIDFEEDIFDFSGLSLSAPFSWHL